MREKPSSPTDSEPVGPKIREIRSMRSLCLRELAKKSGLSINTLSLIENGKSSPSVSTLQQLAHALEVPITSFFETEPVQKQVVYTLHDRRPLAEFRLTRMESLGKDLAGNGVQPFVVTLPPKTGSGQQMIVHTGLEFVYCLSGKICYQIEQVRYPLEPGDSLVFESPLPHRWENMSDGESQMILAIIPFNPGEESGGHHFPN